MLCPEVVDFPAPKTMSTMKLNDTLESVFKTISMNSFYKSLIITCPDEIQAPASVQEIITEDSDYYMLSDCSLTEFIEPTFIANFVIKGNLYCLSANRNCIIENCAAITPDGVLIIHVLEFIFQTLGMEGTKRPHDYYEVKIDLKTLKQYNKVKQSLLKLELLDFYLIWEPHEENICPSSIAKYFHDRNIKVSSQSLTLNNITPTITEVPSIKDVDIDEMVEWLGMLAHNADLYQEETYISTYCQPDSDYALKTTRISVLIVKGFLTPNLIIKVCKSLSDFTMARSLENYWTAVSVQSQEDSLWKWNSSSVKMFQAHDSSYNAFFSSDRVATYSMGQIKYS